MVSPLGMGAEASWSALINGESACEFDKIFGVYTARVKGLPLPDEMRQLAMAFLAAKEALSTSKLDKRQDLIIGQAIAESKLNAFNLKNAATVSLSGQLRNVLQLTGPAAYGTSACATSSMLVINACKIIEAGECDIVLCGSAETPLSPLYAAGFNNMGVLSKTGARPFDARRDGFAIAEGAAFVVVESLKSAISRNAKIYAEISGVSCGIIGDNTHSLKADKLSKVVDKACACLPDYVHAHGSATKLNDYEESKAFAKVFGAEAEKINFSSTKAAVGHMLGASGAAGVIFAAMAVANNVAPPTINFESTDINFNLNYTPNNAVKKTVNTALSASYGFGGQGTVIVLKKSIC
jgi:3-oxoacyl-[acyl-carrier-protein] synthase II